MSYNILAVAIGDGAPDRTIIDWTNLGGVRPYIPGLMLGLAKLGHIIGTEYTIYYRERANEAALNAATFSPPPPAGVARFDTIFCMSTTVVRAAQAYTRQIPIVGIVSDPADEGFAATGNICGISARRHQTAGDGFDRFVDTVTTLTTVYYMHKLHYGPSESALARIKARAHRRSPAPIAILPLPLITDAASIAVSLAALPNRNLANPPTVGLLVLPVDVCFANAQTIINTAQGAPYYVPTFFPTPDWVKPAPSSALGGYGVSQRTCGELLAERVDYALWQHPGQIPLPLPRFLDAPDHSLEWWVSSAAAAPAVLNVVLGANVPIVS